MKGSKSFQKCIFILFLIGCIFTVTVQGAVKVGIEVLDEDGVIRIGEPLNVHVSVELEQPVVAGSLNPFHDSYCEINNVSKDANSVTILKIPSSFMVEDPQGLKYGQSFTIFYDHFKKRIVFDQVGEYIIKFPFTRSVSSQTKIKVEKASPLNEKAISLLSDPNDYYYLEFGRHEDSGKRSERISHLRQVIKQCGDTLLVKWAAARLGIEQTEELKNKYVDGHNFLAEYGQKRVIDPLLDQAQMHLGKAYQLPDEFPIRENVLMNLVTTELINKNYGKSLSLIEELSSKYPHGEYGRKAPKLKEEFLELQKRELAQAPQPQFQEWKYAVTLGTIFAGVIVVSCYYLARKKKRAP